MVDYQGYEELSRFLPGQLRSYRQMLLEKTQPQVEFVRKHVPNCRRVVEIGSGNGRLLIALALRGSLSEGLGLDLSQSRVDFARRWEFDLRLREGNGPLIEFFPLNVLKCSAISVFDLAVCITGCFQYFTYDDAKKVLYLMRNSAAYALFELYHRPTNPRSWHRLPDSDRFAYLLDNYTPENPTVHTKTFIGRDGLVDIRTEQLYYYGDVEFRQLLVETGFDQVLWDVSDEEKRVVLVA